MSHYDTQYNHKQRCLQAVRDVIYWTVQSHWSHAEWLRKRKTMLLDTNSYQRLTRYNRNYVDGYFDAKMADVEFEHHDWRVYHPKHGHVRKEANACLDGIWSEVVPNMGASFWKDTEDKVWAGSSAVYEMYDGNPEDGEAFND